MGIYMGTTEIAASRTAGEIQELLAVSGAEAVEIKYERGQASGIAFRIIRNGHPLHFSLPIRWKAVYRIMETAKAKSRGRTKKVDEGQARRTAWRQVLRWIEAQVALIDTNIVELEEVFLPYMQVDPDGTTFYQKAIKAGDLPALPAPKSESSTMARIPGKKEANDETL